MTTATYVFRGKRLRIKEIAAVSGMSESTARRRISGDRVLEGDELKDPHVPKPISPRHARRPRTFTHDGKTLTIPQWAKETGICAATLRERLTYYLWPVERALTEPPNTVRDKRRRQPE